MSTSIQKKATWQRLNQADGGRVWIEPRTGDGFGLPIDDVELNLAVDAAASRLSLILARSTPLPTVDSRLY